VAQEYDVYYFDMYEEARRQSSFLGGQVSIRMERVANAVWNKNVITHEKIKA